MHSPDTLVESVLRHGLVDQTQGGSPALHTYCSWRRMGMDQVQLSLAEGSVYAD
jgi:hypothetical protein